jgi:hypothetical protein
LLQGNYIKTVINNHLKAARIFARLMDNQFSFLGVGFGLDSIIGIVPGAGDLLSLVLSFYLIWIGFDMKLPAEKITQMVGNVLVDAFIGTVPFIGDIADVFFKANIKNLRILEEFANNGHGTNNVFEGEVVAG